MNQDENELQLNLDNYQKAMEENMRKAEKNKKELMKRMISVKTHEIFDDIYDVQHDILTNFITLFLKNNPYKTLDEQEKEEIDLLKDSKWIMLNEQNTLIVSAGQTHQEFAFDELSQSTQKIIKSYQNAIKKNPKLKELHNLLSKIKGKEFNNEIEQKIVDIEENFRNIAKDTDIQLVDDIIYNIDTFKEVINENGEKSYVGVINGEEKEFKEIEDMGLAMAIDSSLLTYHVFMNSMPKADSKISLSTEYLNTGKPIKDNGNKKLKAHEDDVQNMHDDSTKQEEIDKQMEEEVNKEKENELSEEEIEAIKTVFNEQTEYDQNKLKRYANKKSDPKSLSDKADEKLEEIYDSAENRVKKVCKSIYYHTPLWELRRFKNRVLSKVGFRKQQIEGANLSMITGKKEDENKPLFVSKKMAKKIKKLGAAKIAVTQDGAKALETGTTEKTREELKSQDTEVKDSEELVNEERMQTIDESQVEKNESTVDEPQVEEKESNIDESHTEKNEPAVDEPQVEEIEPIVDEPQVEEKIQYDKLKEFALKTIASQQLIGKDLENALNSVDLTEEDLHLYHMKQLKFEREKWKNSMKSDIIRYINSLDDEDKKKEMIEKYEKTSGNKIRDIELQENVALPENELEARTYEKNYQENQEQKEAEQRQQNAIDREITLSNLASRYPLIAANPSMLDEINEKNKGKFEITQEDVVSYLDPVSEQDYDTKRDDFIKLVSSADGVDKIRLLGGTEGCEANRYGVTLDEIRNYQNGTIEPNLEVSTGKSK